MKAKKRIFGGKEYKVYGSTIEREGFQIVEKRYTTSKGVVTIKNGMIHHPDGEKTPE